MNLYAVLLFVFAAVFAMSTVTAAPEPGWKPFKKLEKVGRNIRDGLIKAGPAVQVVGDAATIYRG